MPFLMKTGDIDALAFIGGSKAADDLIRQHPHPHRLKVFLQLEAKNMGVSGLRLGLAAKKCMPKNSSLPTLH